MAVFDAFMMTVMPLEPVVPNAPDVAFVTVTVHFWFSVPIVIYFESLLTVAFAEFTLRQ